jgi:hypothetical protein
VVEDVADDVGVGEAGDDLEAAVALGTAGDVFVEHAAEEGSPIEPARPDRRRASGRGLWSSKRRWMVMAGVVGAVLARDDQRSELAPGGEDAMVSKSVLARRGDQSRKSSQKLDRVRASRDREHLDRRIVNTQIAAS